MDVTNKSKRAICVVLDRGKSLFREGFFHIFTGTFLNKAITMILSIVVARAVDKAEYAYFSFSENIINYILLFAGFGMASAILKTCAGQDDSCIDYAYWRYAIKKGIPVTLLITIVVLIICMFCELPFPKARKYLLVFALYPAFYYLYDIALTYMRAKRKIKLYTALSLIYTILLAGFSVLLVFIIDAYGLIVAKYMAIISIGLLAFIYIRKSFANVDKTVLSKEVKKELWFLAITLMFTNACSTMMPQNENMLVSSIIKDETITADFRVAGVFPNLILLVTQAVNTYYFPIIARKYTQGNKVRKQIIKIGLFNAALVSFATAIGILITPTLIGALYGKKYLSSIPLASALWFMRASNAAIRLVPKDMLVAVNKVKFSLITSIATLILQIFLDWVFLVWYGIIGIAYGTIILYLISGIGFWVYLIKTTA